MKIERLATKEEIRIYRKVNAFLDTLTDNEYSEMVEKISVYVFEYRKNERRKAYNRLYRTAVKIGVTVSDLGTWFCMDEI